MFARAVNFIKSEKNERNMTTKALLSMICLALLASSADAQSVNLPLANKLAEDADPELSRINLTPTDIAPLGAFLRTLSEDYD